MAILGDVNITLGSMIKVIGGSVALISASLGLMWMLSDRVITKTDLDNSNHKIVGYVNEDINSLRILYIQDIENRLSQKQFAMERLRDDGIEVPRALYNDVSFLKALLNKTTNIRIEDVADAVK